VAVLKKNVKKKFFCSIWKVRTRRMTGISRARRRRVEAPLRLSDIESIESGQVFSSGKVYVMLAKICKRRYQITTIIIK